MISLRACIDQGKLRLIDPLPSGSDGAEVLIVMAQPTPPIESLALMRLQEQTGFVREVLAAPSEEVWNDLRPAPSIPQDR